MVLAIKRKNQNHKRKSARQLERIFKGVANHRRIEILFAIKNEPGLTLFSISEQLDCNLKTIAEHVRRLVIAGLVNKNRLNNNTLHELSPYGKKIVKILESF